MHTGLGTPNSDLVDKRPAQHADPNLGQLRAQIKKVMIPMLIKIFELKLAAQQASTPPSRLQKQQSESVTEILAQLSSLEEELKLLQLWCLSCQKQVERALGELAPKEETAQPPSAPPRFTQTPPENPSDEQSSSNWLRKFLKK